MPKTKAQLEWEIKAREIVDANRNSSLNNIPLDKLFIYNHPSLIQDLI